MGDSRYSFSLTTFSPSGKLGQIEHALAAVSQGVTCIGVKATNGVVLVTEKKAPSPLIDIATLSKVDLICDNVGMTYSGMGPDYRLLLGKARQSAQTYKQVHGEYPAVAQVVRSLADVMQEYTQSGGVRPFGVSLLVAGRDQSGPSLYQVDPSGAYWPWKASALGKNMLNAKTFLEKRYNADMELEDAIHTALLTLKEGFEGQLTADVIEMGIVRADSLNETSQQVLQANVKPVPAFQRVSVNEIRDYLANL